MHKYCRLARLTRLFLPGWSNTLTKPVANMIDASLETKALEYSNNQGSLMPHGTMKNMPPCTKENVPLCTMKKWDQQGFFLVV